VQAWHALTLEEACERLESDCARGLTEPEAAARLARHGRNLLAASRGRSGLSILLHQFRSMIVLLLIAATIIAFLLGERVEAAAILIVILLNASIGFLIEWKAERTLSALRRHGVAMAHVLRDGVEREIVGAELVPGDVVVIAGGARVPADGRVIESVRLQIDEAALTGESRPVTKATDPVADEAASLGDRVDMAYLGTAVTDGRGRLLVTATGRHTELGQIGTLVSEAVARETPLEKKLGLLGRWLIGIVLALCAIIVAAGWLRGNGFLQMLEVGISLAIAAVPEGLPAVATMTLALGMQRMVRMGAIIRRLPAVETLGSTTVICTDKTGTLTRNEMTVRAFILDGRRIDVTGGGYGVAGEFLAAGQPVDRPGSEHLGLALRIGALCNDARIERAEGRATVLGDPTEAALIVAAEKAGLDHAALVRDHRRLHELPFDSVKQRMITVHETPERHTVAYVKGAPATVLEASSHQLTAAGASPLTPGARQGLLDGNQELADATLRVLALAYKELPDAYEDAELARGLTFVGLVGMEDPLRDEARAAIATCREAGIRTVMITGDQRATAGGIARQLGIDQDADGHPLQAVHGRDLNDLDATGWQRVVSTTAVFARVSPKQKLQIVEALQADAQIVAMTGDGVNDAPALKRADIGIAMGRRGTEVAKEAAAMIITDDDFASIVAAVEQGRIIYANILKFIHYLFSCNTAEILVIFVAIMIGWPLPLGPLQILWLNMVTDVFPALALALEPSAPGVMRQPPRDPKEPLVSGGLVWLIAWQGVMLAGFTLVAFVIGMRWHGTTGGGLRLAMTMAFMTLALIQVVHAFNARAQRRSAFSRIFTNGWLWAAVVLCLLLQAAAVYVPVLQRVLHTAGLTAADWGVIMACSLAPIPIVETAKLARRWMGSGPVAEGRL
jgi:Ca2+-transporting ATPase